METKYQKTFNDLKSKIEREKKKRIFDDSSKANSASYKNELETIFIESIEEVRKDIMKRRLKQELMSRRKFKPFETGSHEAEEFEQSVLKLAQLAKGKIKMSEFNPQDKCSLLDIFVNNETTLLRMYEALFPKNNNVKNDNYTVSYKTNEYQFGDKRSGSRDYSAILGNDTESISTVDNRRNLDMLEESDIRQVC